MPFVFSHVEYCDMHFVYGFCNGNASAAVEEYRRRYPKRRIPSRGVFTRVQQTLRDNGSSVRCSQRMGALTSQDNISCGLRKVLGNLRTNTTAVRVFL